MFTRVALAVACLSGADALKVDSADPAPVIPPVNRTEIEVAVLQNAKSCVEAYATEIDEFKPELNLGAHIRMIELESFREDRREMVFGAGSGSTATHSLYDAMTDNLGMNGWHFDIHGEWTHDLEDIMGNWAWTRTHVGHGLDDVPKCYNTLNWFDYTKIPQEVQFIMDEPTDIVFLHLFAIFPRAKFILSKRPLSNWVTARRGHKGSLAPMVDACGKPIEDFTDAELEKLEAMKQKLVKCVVPKERLFEVDVFSETAEERLTLVQRLAEFTGRAVVGGTEFPEHEGDFDLR